MTRGAAPKSAEHRAKIAAALRGRKRPEVSARLKGSPVVAYERTPEHRAKMSRIKKGEELPGRRPDAVAYAQAHHAVTKARGVARDYACVDCGEQAAEWSFKHGSGYSMDPTDYEPRCVRCHRVFDAA